MAVLRHRAYGPMYGMDALPIEAPESCLVHPACEGKVGRQAGRHCLRSSQHSDQTWSLTHLALGFLALGDVDQ